MNIEKAKTDIARRTKKGLSFILASVILWIIVCIIWIVPIENVFTRNLFTFCATTPLMPLAYGFSKIIKAEFSVKNNPLNNLGLLFSINQLSYILIAMWAYSQAPYSMVMIIAMIFGAHLLPFSWLYNSRAYLIFSIVIPLIALFMGSIVNEASIYMIPLVMVGIEIIFAFSLFLELKLNNQVDRKTNFVR